MALTIALLLVLAGMTAAFGDKASVASALSAWCTNPANAEATYGQISTWDVSTVTDLSYLIHNAPCKSTFN